MLRKIFAGFVLLLGLSLYAQPYTLNAQEMETISKTLDLQKQTLDKQSEIIQNQQSSIKSLNQSLKEQSKEMRRNNVKHILIDSLLLAGAGAAVGWALTK